MQIISHTGKMSLFEVIMPTTKARGTRALLIEDFCKELDKDVGRTYKNKEGKLVKVKKCKPATVAFFMSHIKTDDLFYFLSDCRQAKCGFKKAYYAGLNGQKFMHRDRVDRKVA